MKIRNHIILGLVCFMCCGISFAQSNTTLQGEFQVENKVEVYPNPSTDYLFVKISNSTLEKVEFELHSIIGNQLKTEFEEVKPGVFRIPVLNLSNGYYFVVVKDEEERYKQAYKFLKR